MNNTPYIYTLPQLVELASASNADKEAFRFGKTSITYRELERKMNQLAYHLHQTGTRKGDRVGIYMNRCLETAIAIYGIMKAGAIFVPLNPSSPIDYTSFLIHDCGIKTLVTTAVQEKRVRVLMEGKTSLEYLVGFEASDIKNSVSWSTIFNLGEAFVPPFRLLDEDLAYIMYTSGSTGKPKGIMHTHRSGLNYARNSMNVYGVLPQDRIANHAPIYFDIATFGYFTGPLAGATTIIISDAHTTLPPSLSLLMEEESITIWYSVPLALQQLLTGGILGQRNLSSLRWVLFGGEVFQPKYLSDLYELLPQSKFSNVYGPAEINQCTYYNFSKLNDLGSPVPIGVLWENADCKLLDESDREIGVGQVGELVVRTASMMSGYWNNPALTEKSLFIHTNHSGLAETYYRTGDLMRYGTDKLLYFVGRNDRQVKVRGHRVELNEIEQVLMRHSQVLEASVMVRTDRENEIVAAVIPIRNTHPSSALLRKHCKENLPPYSIPVIISIVNKFPRTGSDKVDRNKLLKLLSEK